jgi:hypothetical protein
MCSPWTLRWSRQVGREAAGYDKVQSAGIDLQLVLIVLVSVSGPRQ